VGNRTEGSIFVTGIVANHTTSNQVIRSATAPGVVVDCQGSHHRAQAARSQDHAQAGCRDHAQVYPQACPSQSQTSH